MLRYAEFNEAFEDNIPEVLKETKEETLIALCEGLNVIPEKAKKLKLSFVAVYKLAKEKKIFMEWLLTRPEEN